METESTLKAAMRQLQSMFIEQLVEGNFTCESQGEHCVLCTVADYTFAFWLSTAHKRVEQYFDTQTLINSIDLDLRVSEAKAIRSQVETKLKINE